MKLFISSSWGKYLQLQVPLPTIAVYCPNYYLPGMDSEAVYWRIEHGTALISMLSGRLRAANAYLVIRRGRLRTGNPRTLKLAPGGSQESHTRIYYPSNEPTKFSSLYFTLQLKLTLLFSRVSQFHWRTEQAEHTSQYSFPL